MATGTRKEARIEVQIYEKQQQVFLLENNIKIEREKQRKIEDSTMTIPILKILYEFWIIDSYD